MANTSIIPIDKTRIGGRLVREFWWEGDDVHVIFTDDIQAARRGVKVSGAVLYCTMEPCVGCATDIINVGIRRVIAKHGYHGAGLTREWFKKAGVELVTINSEPLKY